MAPYTELDFPTFNPEGFRRIHQTVEMARQQKVLAQTAEELRQAANSLRAAGERKSLEHQIARNNFEAERQRSFQEIEVLQKQFRTVRLPGARRLEIETRIDHLVTLFNLKDFAAVRKGIVSVTEILQSKPARPVPVAPALSNRGGVAVESATSLFNQALALEQNGRTRQAVEVYGRVLERNPRHFQAIRHLQLISRRGGKAAW
jgi:tetratricopeptide (TPR) repeat protein